MKKALIMVDLQNDFCEGGSLAVSGSHEIIPLANQLQAQFDLVVATKDWHPRGHMSFAENHPQKNVGDIIKIGQMSQVLWPMHCVQESRGSDFHSGLKTDKIDHIIFKGTDKTIDSYSAFFDNAHLRSTGLGEYLKKENVKDLYIMGLATDYCVKFSCLDAVALGFNVYVIEDACRGVDLMAGDSAAALEEMEAAGVKRTHSKSIMSMNRQQTL